MPFRPIAAIFPRQTNEFVIFIDKAGATIQPWIDPATGLLAGSAASPG